MRVGTRSVLFGAHALWLHPFFVAAAWSRLYGFPFDVRLCASFWLHDIGYIGCRDMDGADGERHVDLGGRVMEVLFGREWGDFYKLCGTRAHCKIFSGAAGDGGPGQGGSQSPCPGQQCRS